MDLGSLVLEFSVSGLKDSVFEMRHLINLGRSFTNIPRHASSIPIQMAWSDGYCDGLDIQPSAPRYKNSDQFPQYRSVSASIARERPEKQLNLPSYVELLPVGAA
ncbi:hypothetical protein AVEN_45085-1 [Araneus ventricosus]|uniref:Uncharacterized protein n=1 Tax=Araneus ventricosus TaxID=182803 RepID=A0A4Y2FQ13_ARAVE|nr:hypothetical protein AVEN_45085-1 [Araneus ventricosus]